MAKYLDAKCKKCRREGLKLFIKGDKCYSPKCPIIKRNFPPGAHGGNRVRLTEYGQQMREKQKAKRTYGILERQFRNYYEKAMSQVGDTGELIQQYLEMRLDNVVFRSGFAPSRRQARQLVNHNFFAVNGKKVNIPSFQVKIKDEITIKPSKLKTKAFAELDKKLEKYETPAWLHVDLKTKTIRVLTRPTGAQLEKNFNPRSIVEFYSK
jgi:small subunit ribosomal protein S4